MRCVGTSGGGTKIGAVSNQQGEEKSPNGDNQKEESGGEEMGAKHRRVSNVLCIGARRNKRRYESGG